jgi:hypothetical protein
MYEFLYFHDLTGNLGGDRAKDGLHSFAEAEGMENTLGLLGHTNAGAHECYAEVGHFRELIQKLIMSSMLEKLE